ncbi:enoyl-CoA hydratase-related protein [Saccharopolyspora terrae]|nr:enoyl-CoA hydratase-related protein [Saccharopolyspora terrae]
MPRSLEALMLDLEHRDVAVLVRIRPADRRVLTAELLDSLTEALAYIGPDRAVVLTGARGVFAPDLDPVEGPSRDAARLALPAALSALRAHPLPVVAALNGDAVGAGYALAAAADVRIMSTGTVQPASGFGPHRTPESFALGSVDFRCTAAELISLALHQVRALSRREFARR